MKKIVDHWPFYLPLLGVVIGFLVHDYQFLTVPFLMAFSCWLAWIVVQNRFHYFQSFIVTLLVFLILGFARLFQVNHEFQLDMQHRSKAVAYKISISQNLGKRKNWYRFECSIDQLKLKHGQWVSVYDASLDLYLKDSLSIQEGQSLLLHHVHFIDYQGAALPGDFDLRNLKYSRKFIGTIFAKSANVVVLKNIENEYYAFRNRVKSHLNRFFVQNLSPNNLMLVRQLVWGDKTQIENDLKSAFQISGTTHVLSVSGMHMALLFAFIHFILDRISHKKQVKRYMKLSIIPILWMYAFFTGFSAPVLRAVSFFTYYLIGNVFFGRSLKLLHVLLVVGLVQLLVDPFSIKDIGFQLSYLAVLGLSLILPILKKFYENYPVWIQWILDAFAISLSSALTTYPLVLFYFHQFSVWFLLGNLLLLPLFTVLMYWLFFMIFMAFFSIPMGWLATVLNGYLNIVSVIVKQSVLLPHPYIFAYGFDTFSLVFHFLFIYGLLIFYHRGWRFLVGYFMGFLLLNFTISRYRRELDLTTSWQADVSISEGYFRVMKSGKTIKIHCADNIPQEKIKSKLEYVTHAYKIDTVLYVWKNKPN
jgi:ComEC/Rec2-related protein